MARAPGSYRIRRHRRANVNAEVRIAQRPDERVLIENLSAGGALLVGMPPICIDEQIAVELTLGTRRQWVTGKVVRVHETEGIERVAVRFTDLSAALEDEISDSVMSTLDPRRERAGATVLVVDAPDSARRICSMLEELALTGIAVASFLDALPLLQDPTNNVIAVIVDHDVGNGSGAAMLDWCDQAVPELRRILLVPRQPGVTLEPARRAAHRVLKKPIDPCELARALGRAHRLSRVRTNDMPSWPA